MISTIHFSIISHYISLCSQVCKLICFFPSKLHIYHTIQTLIIYPQTSIRPWQSHPSMNVTYPTFVVIILFCSFRSIPCDLVRLLVVSIEFLIYRYVYCIDDNINNMRREYLEKRCNYAIQIIIYCNEKFTSLKTTKLTSLLLCIAR